MTAIPALHSVPVRSGGLRAGDLDRRLVVLRPKRDPKATSADEPWLPKLAGYALVGLSLAMLWRLFRYGGRGFPV